MVYLEPFAGSGAVFFNKLPGAVETINDLDSDIVNLFRVLREQPEELKRVLALTPYSREEYDLSFLHCDDPVEKARRYMVRTTQAIGALYAHEMDASGQEELLRIIKSSHAKIVISGYESDLYNTALAGWHKDHTMSQTTSTEMAEETIWMNYEPPTNQLSIWEE